jgi:hypothetical protein
LPANIVESYRAGYSVTSTFKLYAAPDVVKDLGKKGLMKEGHIIIAKG